MIARPLRLLACLACLATVCRPAAADAPPDRIWTMAATLGVETVTDGLSFPWSLAFLPDGDMLVTEKYDGTLRRVSPEGRVFPPIEGVPPVYASENGGLLGLALDPAFAANRRLFLAYAEPVEDGTSRLAVARAALRGERLEDLEVVFRQTPAVAGDQNYGGRLRFAPDGTLFIFAGNRFADAAVQDPGNSLGAIVRIRPDGAVPPDNPLAGVEGADPAVWSMGHRNPGGAAFHPETGALYVAEFGPWGGDELNLPFAGSNHGWPEVSWGRPYEGGDIADPPTRPEFEREIFFWSPTVGPAGMTFYSGALVPAWTNSLFLGGLTSASLIRLTVEGDRVLSEERVRLNVRIRDVAEGPDGALYLLTDEPAGRILRLHPERLDQDG